ncbi:MAG: ATP-binding protein [Candidatus Aegiribacteria sp.]
MKNAPGLRVFLDSVSDAVVLADGTRRITYMNPEARRIIGCGSSGGIGGDLWEICRVVDSNTRTPLRNEAEEILPGNGLYDFPLGTVLVTADGDDVLVSGTVFLSDEAPGSIGGMVFRDVSARWLLDRSLRNVQKADTVRVIARGITGRIHDLLTVLLAKLSAAGREHGDREAVLRNLRESRKIIGRISEVVSSLGADPGSREGADLCNTGKVIMSCARLFNSVHEGTELELAFPDRTGFAALPGGLLEQVLINLLMNAGQAAGHGGRVLLAACRAALSGDITPAGAGNYVMVSVSDNGPGIHGDNLTRIFSPRFTTGRNRYGLGLSAVYSIVHGFGGCITVDSRPGRGSTFTVYLPAAEGIETETSGDVMPVVYCTGLDQVEADRAARMLEAIGCAPRPGLPVRGQEEFRLLLTDHEYFAAERQALAGEEYSLNGVIVAMDESLRLPVEHGPEVIYIGSPVGMGRLAAAVGELAWKRVPDDPEAEDGSPT